MKVIIAGGSGLLGTALSCGAHGRADTRSWSSRADSGSSHGASREPRPVDTRRRGRRVDVGARRRRRGDQPCRGARSAPDAGPPRASSGLKTAACIATRSLVTAIEAVAARRRRVFDQRIGGRLLRAVRRRSRHGRVARRHRFSRARVRQMGGGSRPRCKLETFVLSVFAPVSCSTGDGGALPRMLLPF